MVLDLSDYLEIPDLMCFIQEGLFVSNFIIPTGDGLGMVSNHPPQFITYNWLMEMGMKTINKPKDNYIELKMDAAFDFINIKAINKAFGFE